MNHLLTPLRASAIVAAVSAILSTAAAADGMKYREAAPISETKSLVLFSGTDFAKDATYSYQGAILALNRDIGRDGFMLRVYGSYVGYEYDNGAIRTDGTGWQGDAMIGYKAGFGPMWAAVYVGVDYQNHDLSPPDPSNPVEGTEFGFKVAADFATLRTQTPIYVSLSGDYSTAFHSYWARARAGVNHQRFTFGPEAVALGNEGFDATRVGGFVMFDFNLIKSIPLEITLSAGYQFVNDSGSGGAAGSRSGGGEGTYGGISFTSLF